MCSTAPIPPQSGAWPSRSTWSARSSSWPRSREPLPRDTLSSGLLLGARGQERRVVRSGHDPGSELDALAVERGFRAVFHGEPTIGGRYSALSVFGLVPAGAVSGDRRQGSVRAALAVETAAARTTTTASSSGWRCCNWRDGSDKVLVVPDPGGFGPGQSSSSPSQRARTGKASFRFPAKTRPGRTVRSPRC